MELLDGRFVLNLIQKFGSKLLDTVASKCLIDFWNVRISDSEKPNFYLTTSLVNLFGTMIFETYLKLYLCWVKLWNSISVFQVYLQT